MSDYSDYMELVKEVAEIDQEAAEYLRSPEVKRLPAFEFTGRLTVCFFWEDTPQGHNYWGRICDIVHPGW